MRFDVVVCRDGGNGGKSNLQTTARRAIAKVCSGILGAALLLASAGDARATVTLPNGLVVPGASSSSSETTLPTLFLNRGEGINWQTDAHATPDSFSPLCDFTATLVLKQSQSSLAVGWYNVIPNAASAPSPSDIYMIIPAGSAVGTTATGATIRADARYRGGLIGFALIRTPSHFTERKWNTVCNAGPCASTPGPWTLSLAYKSTVTPNGYYVAFEDGDTSSTGWNNDGDYNDYVFFFTGLSCAGAGAACVVPGKVGVCAQGFTECDAAGALTCKQVTQPSAEKCDGVDNDCNDTIDEGDLCPTDSVCSKGKCVKKCGGSEFTCAPGTVCREDLCVDPACVDVTCPSGELCREGVCKAACEGIVCPHTQVCRIGRCVDPCAGVTCPGGRVCESGVCVTSCTCQACANALTCNAPSGKCVEPACATVTCTTGTRCSAGTCVPICQGVVCPSGQACENGECADIPASEIDSGTFDPGPVPGEGDAGPGAGAADGGGGPNADSEFGKDRKASCGCRVTGGGSDPSPLLFVALGAVSIGAARWRKRRR